MIETNDDDWELFVPVKGEKYPDACQYRYRRIDHKWSEWSRGPIGVADYPRNDIYQYRKPKQKGNKVPERTPQQALKDAIDSGAVDAWINGEEIQRKPHLPCDDWTPANDWYDFANPSYEFRPAPPEPTRINWRPVVTGKEPKGTWLCWYASGNIRSASFVAVTGWSTVATPTHYAPMCNRPEGNE